MQLDHRQAHADGDHVIAPMLLARSTAGTDVAQVIAAAPHRLTGTFDCGGQEHMYLEGQVALAIPLDDGAVLVHSSTQHPSEVQHGSRPRRSTLPTTESGSECRRMGGAFGGKETQAAQVGTSRRSPPCAWAARCGCASTGPRHRVTGKRHPFHATARSASTTTDASLAIA